MTALIPEIPSVASDDSHHPGKFAALQAKPILDSEASTTTVKFVPRRDDTCELELTAARLEMARLRALALDAMRCGDTSDAPVECPPPSAPIAAMQTRRAYAAPALGEPSERREVLPPLRPEPLRMMQQVTNLGTLVDVLL